MAARNNKDVFVINPQTRESQERGDLGMRRPLFAAGLGAAGITGFIREILVTQKKPAEETLSRRDFLRRGVTGAALAGSVGTYVNHAHLQNLNIDWENEQKNKLEAVKKGVNGMIEKGLITHDDSPERQADKLIWCMNDWRNAVTALGILQMNQHDAQVQNDSEKYTKGDGPLVHFEGAMHVGVQDYLRNSKLTEERVNFYNDTFNEDGNLSIRRFRFNKETEKFDMLSEDPIIYKENGDI
jgi:hypothetical protein